MKEENDDEETEHEMPFVPFFSRFSILSNLARMRAEEEAIEQDMIRSAMQESMDTYHQSLFRKNSRLRLDLAPFLAEKDDEGECFICLEPIRVSEEVVRLHCNHLFHAACIQDIVSHQHGHCPLCREAIPIREKTPSPVHEK